MTRTASPPVTAESMATSFERIGREMGEKIGSQLSARIQQLQASRKPFTFKGGVPLATFSADEAQAVVENLELFGAYANDAENLAAGGISLEAYVRGELADEHGIGMVPGQGYEAHMSDAFRAALSKQSQKFAERFAVRGMASYL